MTFILSGTNGQVQLLTINVQLDLIFVEINDGIISGINNNKKTEWK